MDKKVSIITPCFNGESFVGRYLDSILEQTYKNIELIFINDGSTDNTEKIIKSYIPKFHNRGIKLIYICQKNLGQAAALNKGLKVLSGQYLTWPDSDDILSIDSIEKKVKFLEDNKEYGVVRTDATLVKEEDIKGIVGYFAKNNPNKNKKNLFLDLIIENKVWFAPGCYMIRVSSFLDVNPSREIYEGKGGQNWQMLLPILYKYKCGYIDEPLYTYVIRSDSHSHEIDSLYKHLKRCDEHEDILINTIKSMNIKEEKKLEYLNIIKEKYVRKRFNLSCEFSNKKLMRKFYNELKSNIGVTNIDIREYLKARYLIFNIAIRGISKIKRGLAK